MNLREKAIKGVIWNAIQNWGRQAIASIVFFLLARLLTPDTFGLIALAGVFLAFIGIFIDQGFSTAIVQRQELEPEHLDTAFWINIGIGLLMTIFGILSASFVASLFSQPQLTPIIRWLSLTFVFSSFSRIQQAILERQLNFKSLAIRSLIAVIAGGLVGVTMAFIGFGVWSLVGQQLVNAIVQVLVLWWVSDWRPGFNFSKKHFQELFSFGINIMGGSLVSFFSRRSDDFLIGYFLGPVALGYYSVAYRLLLIATELLSGIISQVATPTFSRLQQEPEKARRAFYQATQLTSFIAFPAFLSMAVLTPELVEVLFGKQWLPSIPVMQILALIGILHAVFTFKVGIITAMGKPSWNLRIGLINTIIQVISFFVVVRWGIVAVAAAYVISSYLLSFLRLWAVYKLIKIDLSVYFRQYIAPLAGSLAIIIVISGVKYFLTNLISVYVLLAICILFAVVIYLAVIFLIEPVLLKKVNGLVRLALPTASR